MDLCISTTLDLFRDVYRNLDAEVQGLSDDELTWTPAPDTNSIAVLVVHTIGSAEEVVRVVRGMSSDRDRDAEFIPNDLSEQALRARLCRRDPIHRRHSDRHHHGRSGGYPRAAESQFANRHVLAAQQLRPRPRAPRPHPAHEATLRPGTRVLRNGKRYLAVDLVDPHLTVLPGEPEAQLLGPIQIRVVDRDIGDRPP